MNISATTPYQASYAPAADQAEGDAGSDAGKAGLTDGALLQMSASMQALMALLVAAQQNSNINGSAALQGAAKKVLADLPQGAHPQWLDQVKEISVSHHVDAAQLQSAHSTLLASMQTLLPLTDPHRSGNQHHHTAKKMPLSYA